MTHAQRCHRPRRDRLAQSLLFMGCASTWGLTVLLFTAMLADVRFRPFDSEQVAAVLDAYLQKGMPNIASESVIVVLAGLASVAVSWAIVRTAHVANRERLMKTLFVLHLTGLATAAYLLHATMTGSLNVLSTGPPTYPIHALDAVLYFLLQIPPGVALLLTSAVVLGSHLRTYWHYSQEGLQIAFALAGMAILHTELVFLLGKAASDLGIWL